MSRKRATDKAKTIEMFTLIKEQETQISKLIEMVKEDRSRIETLETELAIMKSMPTPAEAAALSKHQATKERWISQSPKIPPMSNQKEVHTTQMKGAVSHVTHANGVDSTTYLYKIPVIHQTAATPTKPLQAARIQQTETSILHDTTGTQIRHEGRNNDGPLPHPYSRLHGATTEQGSHIYLHNILVEDENDEEIFSMIREYAKDNNLRIMSHKVIRNKYTYDVVGCKIVVPASQEKVALNASFWPSNIESRRWERMLPRRAQQQSHSDFGYGNRYGRDNTLDEERWD